MSVDERVADSLYWGMMVAGFFLYFIPALVAAGRSHAHANAICVFNAFLGWTLLGWVVALIWAFLPFKPAAPALRACPYCAEPIQAAAIVCRFCRMDLRQGTKGSAAPPADRGGSRAA